MGVNVKYSIKMKLLDSFMKDFKIFLKSLAFYHDGGLTFLTSSTQEKITKCNFQYFLAYNKFRSKCQSRPKSIYTKPSNSTAACFTHFACEKRSLTKLMKKASFLVYMYNVWPHIYFIGNTA